MKKNTVLLISIVATMLAVLGCVQTMEAVSKPGIQTVERRLYTAQLEPVASGQSFVAFTLTLKNQSDADLFVDWNQSHYVHDGVLRGRFVFQGIDPAAVREGTVPDDVIPAGGTFTRQIAAHQLLAMYKLRDSSVGAGESGLRGGPMPAGENGILLVMKQDGKRIRDKLTVELLTR